MRLTFFPSVCMKFIQGVVCINSPLLFIVEYSTVQMYHGLFIYLQVKRHLGCLPFSIVSGAAINICIQMFMWAQAFIFLEFKCLGAKLLGLMVTVCLLCKKLLNCSPVCYIVPCYILNSRTWACQVPYILASICYCRCIQS